MSCFLQENYQVNDILLREIRELKAATTSRMTHKRGGVKQGAAVLTSNASERVAHAVVGDNVEAEATDGVKRYMRRGKRDCIADKE